MRKLTFLFAFCIGYGLVLPAARGEQKHVDEKVYRAVIDNDGVQRVKLLGGSYFFDPNHIIVKVNVPVEIQVRKEAGIVPHDIVMKSPDAGMDFKESLETEPKTIRFTPSRIGRYPFYCDKKLLFFESHRKKGMEGIIEVVE